MGDTHLVDKGWAGHRFVQGSGGTWIFTEAVHGFNPAGVVLEEGLVDNTIVLNGKFDAPGDGGVGILASGLRTEIEIGKSGFIDAYVGAKLTGTDQTLVNNGLISGGNTALVVGAVNATVINNGTLQSALRSSMVSDNGLFVNNGSIYGYQGLSFGGTDSELRLNGTSVVSGESDGIESLGAIGTTVTIINRGLVTGGDRGLSLYNADFHVVNRGEIIGDVVSFKGDSIFDFRGGKLDGHIYGGTGDDTYLLSSRKIAIVENADGGYDTIRSAVSYDLSTGVNFDEEIEALILIGSRNTDATGDENFNRLVGSKGDNTLSGNGGTDILDGGKGNDRLSGGTGTDYFTFRTGSGRDVVTDFVRFADQIELTNWKGIDGFEDMIKHHLKAADGDIVISAGQDSLTLEGIGRADLEAVDFNF